MGHIINPAKAFRVCRGYKLDDHLFLWSPGVVGMLNKEQIKECKTIILKNAVGRKKVFHSIEEALRAPVFEDKRFGQVIAVKQCAHLLDVAEDVGVIRSWTDIPAFMDYCMDKLGYNGLKYKVPEYIKEFIDKMLKEEGDVAELIKSKAKRQI